MEFIQFKEPEIFNFYQHLAGHEFCEAFGGPAPDLSEVVVHKNCHLRKKENAKGTLLTFVSFRRIRD